MELDLETIDYYLFMEEQEKQQEEREELNNDAERVFRENQSIAK